MKIFKTNGTIKYNTLGAVDLMSNPKIKRAKITGERLNLFFLHDIPTISYTPAADEIGFVIQISQTSPSTKVGNESNLQFKISYLKQT